MVFGAEWLSDGFDVVLVAFRQKAERPHWKPAQGIGGPYS